MRFLCLLSIARVLQLSPIDLAGGTSTLFVARVPRH